VAWSTPLTAVANAALTAAQWNLSVRDNLLETPAAKATTPGTFFATSAANTIVERFPNEQTVTTSEGTASTTYVDLTTVGPSQTVATGPGALLIVTARITSSTTTESGFATTAVSGATTSAAADARAVRVTGTLTRASATTLIVLTAGSNTFKVQYKSSLGTSTASFADRVITVIPF
jgi:hypothetical protein